MTRRAGVLLPLAHNVVVEGGDELPVVGPAHVRDLARVAADERRAGAVDGKGGAFLISSKLLSLGGLFGQREG